MKVIFVRHGESQANKDSVVAGARLDSPLTEKGREDARKTAAALRDGDFEIDYVVSSPLVRALDTAKIIEEELGLGKDVMVMDELIERDAGGATGMSKGGKDNMLMELASRFDDAETEVAMYERLVRAVAKLREFDGNVLVVSHNGTIRMLRAVIEGLPAGDFKKMPDLSNGEVFVWETNGVNGGENEI